jgi:AraC-like DNA-binding protein
VDLLSPGRADDLSALLRQINVRSAVYCLSELRAPWGLHVDGSATAKFHLVLHGAATLSVTEAGWSARDIAVTEGELVLLPRGPAHRITDRPGSPARPLTQLLAEHPVGASGQLHYGGSGPRTSLLCGGFEIGPELSGELLSLLPPVLVLDAADPGVASWLGPLFTLLREEAAAGGPGLTAVLAKMSDVFLTQAVRRYLAGLDAAVISVPAAASADQEVGRALALMRLHPDAPWTVADLARKVDLSRTAFAARFRALVGEPPMTYLTRLRLGHAAGFLATTDKTLSQVAGIVGYQSESSFCRAFRRAYGRNPGAYRREQLAVPAVRAEQFSREDSRRESSGRGAPRS